MPGSQVHDIVVCGRFTHITVSISTKKFLYDGEVWIWAYQGELERSEFVHFGLEDAAFLCLAISSLDCLNVDKVGLQLL